MIPIGDRNPTRSVPVINYLLLAANIALFAYELSLGNRLEAFINNWGVRSTEVIALLGGDLRLLLPVFLPFFVPAWLMIIIWFAGQLLNSYASVADPAHMTGGVAYGAHIGGFVTGFVLTLFFRRPQRSARYESYQRYSRR